MGYFWIRVVLPVLAVMLSAALAMDLADELAGEWRMGIRPRQDGINLQSFLGKLGGVSASAITNSGNADRPFEVDGDTFPDFRTAADRACDNQKNKCASVANSVKGRLKVSDCEQQNNECKKAIASATATSFHARVSSNDEFDFFCDV